MCVAAMRNFGEILLLADEIASLIRPDAFICPVLRSYCSFPELCEEVRLEKITVDVDAVIL